LTQAITISFGADNVLFFMSTEEQCVGARYGAKPSTCLMLLFGWTFSLHSLAAFIPTGNYPELCSLLNWQILVQYDTYNPVFLIFCFFFGCTDEVVVFLLFSFACTTIWVLGI
jgi:hypothetical protein